MTTTTDESNRSRLQVPVSKIDCAIREGFRKRLATFSPATFFAKPTALSPMVCARFGWENVDVDLLQCSNCRSACSIVFPSVLSAEATAKLCNHYVDQLAEAHAAYCIFRSEAKAYQDEIMAETRKHTLPHAFASVVSAKQLELLENKRPAKVFDEECQRLKEIVERRLKKNLTLPTVNLSANVDGYQMSQPDSSSIQPLLSRIHDALSKDGDGDTSSPKHVNDTAAALALFGLSNVIDHDEDEGTDASRLLVSTECVLCLSQFQVYGISNDDEADANKRQRTRSPLDAHTHYCPYACGFGGRYQQPLWQTLARRLLEKPEDKDMDTVFLEAHGMLHQALSPKFRLGLDNRA